MSKISKLIKITACSFLIAGFIGCSQESEEPLPPKVPEVQGITESGQVINPEDDIGKSSTPTSINSSDYQIAVDYGMETQRLLACGTIDQDMYLERQNNGLSESGITSLSEYDYLQGFSEGVATVKALYDQHPEQKEQECSQASMADTANIAPSQANTDQNIHDLESAAGIPINNTHDVIDGSGLDVDPEGVQPSL